MGIDTGGGGGQVSRRVFSSDDLGATTLTFPLLVFSVGDHSRKKKGGVELRDSRAVDRTERPKLDEMD